MGNSCADTDENRARVVERGSLIAVIGRLKDESLIPFTIPVLYNVLVDYGKWLAYSLQGDRLLDVAQPS